MCGSLALPGLGLRQSTDDKQFALALARATVLFRHAGCNLVVEPSDR
jgi:hypothetical protein